MGDVRMHREPRVDGTRELGEGDCALETPFRDPAAAEHEIESDTDHRFEQDQQEPALRRVRRPAKWHHDQHDDADRPFRDDEQREPEMGLRQKREG